MSGSCGCGDMLTTSSGACFGSGDHAAARTHRYALWRRWSDAPLLVAILLNPSTADESTLDPTLTRVKTFAENWGHGGFITGNAFALRSPYPETLLADPQAAVGPENDSHLSGSATRGSRVILGWGGNLDRKQLRFRYAEMRELLAGVHVACWNNIASGQPEHPLYVIGTTEPRAYDWRYA